MTGVPTTTTRAFEYAQFRLGQTIGPLGDAVKRRRKGLAFAGRSGCNRYGAKFIETAYHETNRADQPANWVDRSSFDHEPIQRPFAAKSAICFLALGRADSFQFGRLPGRDATDQIGNPLSAVYVEHAGGD